MHVRNFGAMANDAFPNAVAISIPVAEEIGRMAERLRFDTTILDMDSVNLRDLLKSTVVIFAISTTGQGEMPQNARLFWKTLLSSSLSRGVLRKVRFSSFGLGDSSYARFNIAHRMLYNRLVQLGAVSICDRGEGNEQHPEGHSAGLREWTLDLQKRLIEAFPLPQGIEPLGDDTFLEPKWKLDLAQRQPELAAARINGTATASGESMQDVVYSNGTTDNDIAEFENLNLKALLMAGEGCPPAAW